MFMGLEKNMTLIDKKS